MDAQKWQSQIFFKKMCFPEIERTALKWTF